MSDNGTFRPDYLVQLTRPAANDLLNKPFPLYDELLYVFSKDRATGAHAETFVDIRSNVPGGSKGVQQEDGLDMEFPTMYNPGMNMSPEDMMGARLGKSIDCRSVLVD
uniref:Retrotransposon protein n=1 Tax=Cucumis melo TaxID=3656 RepID=A0A9I9D629_CUCME